MSVDQFKTLHIYCKLESTGNCTIENLEYQMLSKGEYHSGYSVSCSLD